MLLLLTFHEQNQKSICLICSPLHRGVTFDSSFLSYLLQEFQLSMQHILSFRLLTVPHVLGTLLQSATFPFLDGDIFGVVS